MIRFIYVLIGIAILLMVFNLTKIDWAEPFKDDSLVAVITVVAGLCAILVLAILLTAKKIEKKSKNRP